MCHFFLTAHSSIIFRGKWKGTSIKLWDGKSLIFRTATFESEYDEDNNDNFCQQCGGGIDENLSCPLPENLEEQSLFNSISRN